MNLIRATVRTMATADLASLRLKYREAKDVFLEKDIKVKDPLNLFKLWLNEACETPEILEPNAFCLSTVSKEGIPSARFVLMKGCTEDGFSFFTNYGSRKAKDMEFNPNVAATFYWLPLRRQVRIEGAVTKISHEESEEYFHQRPRASQIGAVASPQSKPIPNREYLDDIETKVKESVGADGVVPMPNWGGYLIKPKAIEFWQGQTNRLHDRIQFLRANEQSKSEDDQLLHAGENGWAYQRLAP